MAKLNARLLDIDAETDGRRLDNYLSSILKNAPKSFIYRIIRRGEVRVNGSRSKPDTRLRTNDKVRIPPYDEDESGAPLIGREKLNSLDDRTIYEDEQLIIINKPSGLAVHLGSGLKFGVIDIMRQRRPDIPDLALAHRLDRDTSGCLILAKSYSSLRAVQRQLSAPDTEKQYLALLAGKVEPRKMEISAPLKTLQNGGEKKTFVDAHGKSALTHLNVREYLKGCTLTAVRIQTGRTHQIRVHCQSIGHPVIGDPKYGEEIANRGAHSAGLRRMFLHAVGITLQRENEAIRVRAPLPPALESYLDSLRC